MKILLYDYHDLEDRPSKHLKVWKAWHTVIYLLAAVFGILNYTFLESTMQLVDDNCILYPSKLTFHKIPKPDTTYITVYNNTVDKDEIDNETESSHALERNNVDKIDKTTEKVVKTDAVAQETTMNTQDKNGEDVRKVKRDVVSTTSKDKAEQVTTTETKNSTIMTENVPMILVLDTTNSYFASPKDCEFAEYMPIMSTVLAILWASMFIMCPGGGRPSNSSGLRQPYKILGPALVCAIVMVGLTGHSFTTTNSGLQSFCAAFSNYTEATTCSSVDPYLEAAWHTWWGIGGRVAATRAAAAGVWGCWACAAALLLARCVAAPDFQLTRVAVYLHDPQQNIMPYLKKQHSNRSTGNSPSKRDTISVKSDPTITTELVTASVEHEPVSDSSSLSSSPQKRVPGDHGEEIELRIHNSAELDVSPR